MGTTAVTIALTSASMVPVMAASVAVSYTIQSGDTFFKIATKNSISLSALEAANSQISNFTNIYPGEIINLPPISYTVQAGDTLYKIAVANGVSMAVLEAANPQITNFNNIMPGQVINVTAPIVSVSPLVPKSINRTSVINFAESLIGIPYSWGGDTLSTGFDCSGFVEYVYAHFGITLMRESHDQATEGTAVAQNALQPGDLLFFQNTDSSASLYANHVTHVGIYIGNGNMIESSSVNNKGVLIVVNVFSNPYYLAHYYGARNVLN